MDDETMSLVNATSVSSRSRTLNSTDSESLMGKLDTVTKAMRVMQSRTYFISGKLARGRERQRPNVTSCMDITVLNRDCKMKIQDHWTAVENLQLMRFVNRSMVLNLIGFKLLPILALGDADSQISISNTGQLENVCNTSEQLDVILRQNMLAVEQEAHEDILLQQQQRTVQAFADLHDIAVTSFNQPPWLQKFCEKIAVKTYQIKVGKALIEAFLTYTYFDLEQNPELLAIMEKWR